LPGPARIYDVLISTTLTVARAQTRILQNGYLPNYLLVTLSAACILIVYGLYLASPFSLSMDFHDVRFYEAPLGLLMIGGAFVAIGTSSRLLAIAALGIVGYAMALLFVLFGAPDLAITQFLIETLSVIIFVLVFYHLPRYSVESSLPTRLRDLSLCIVAGLIITVLMLLADAIPLNRDLINFYARASLTEAHGRNVVNVILVDFRGLDTLGEITVLTLAALGIYALLKLRLSRRKGRV
jgi:multicomponent Na+:H+ antiporter subunit A